MYFQNIDGGFEYEPTEDEMDDAILHLFMTTFKVNRETAKDIIDYFELTEKDFCEDDLKAELYDSALEAYEDGVEYGKDPYAYNGLDINCFYGDLL